MAINLNELTKEIATALAKGDTLTSVGILPNPDEVLRKKGEAKSTYDKVMNDPRVVATMGSRKAGVKKLLWELNRGVDNTDDAAKDFCLEWLNALDLGYIFSKILDAPQYGMQPLEVMWAKDGSRIVPVAVIDKPFDWFGFHNQSRELRFKVKGNKEGLVIPERKILLPRYEYGYDNPYGKPLLSLCFWSVAMKRGALPIYLSYIERFGSARYLATLPKNATDAEHEEALDALESLISDAAATIEEGAKVEVIESVNKGSTDAIFNNFLGYCDQDITLVQLGQILTTGAGDGAGSYALGKVHSDVRADIVDGDAALVEQTINQLIRWTHEINYGKADTAPVFSMYAEEDVDQSLADRDSKLMAGGQVRFTKQYFVDNYGFADQHIEIVEPQSMFPTPEGRGGWEGETPLPLPVAPAAPAAAVAAENSMNGAQIDAMLRIIERVTKEGLPKSTAKALILSGFTIPEARVDDILRDVKEGFATPAPESSLRASQFAEYTAFDAMLGKITDDELEAQDAAFTAPIFALLEGSSSIDDFKNRLGEIYSKLDGDDALTDSLAKQLFAASAEGALKR